ncbi:MAG: family N-acetyltransferase [Rhodospirillales bacterium]|nr:family N-acetyltransferase [Rhodospirillales bacterium]
MSTRNLEMFFSPRSIALIGASRRPRAVGAVVAENLLSSDFDGIVMPVNPHEPAIRGVLAYKDIESLPMAPDLAVIATPAVSVPGLVADLGRRGCRAAIILTAGFEAGDAGGQGQRALVRKAARDNDVRIIGPNCLGIMAPHRGINASFAQVAPLSGRIACVTQSGALATALLERASGRGIGFSKIVSLGDAIDVDFGDMLDYLALDPETDSILLYIEGLSHARKFMAAARAAARVKPILAIKAGRSSSSAQTVKSHTGALAGSDRVYDAAFRRAGIVRVGTLENLFDALEVLASGQSAGGRRLAIITNGGGVGVLAVDALLAKAGIAAKLSVETIATLDTVLPPTWSKANPIDVVGDADGTRYAAALRSVLADPGVDAALVINCPTAVSSSAEAASAMIDCIVGETESTKAKPVLACWLGSETTTGARRKLSTAGIPTFATPERAIDGFTYLNKFGHRAAHLDEVGDLAAAVFRPDHPVANALLRGALEGGKEWLDEADAKALLTAYGVPVARTIKAATPDQVAQAARTLGGMVVVKIKSPDIIHKSDIGGVALDLATPEAARASAQAMLDRIHASQPDARLDGFTVDAMIHRPDSIELIAGLAGDATFGPVILFGQGGVAVDMIDDTAVALPPLTPVLAADLVARTRVSRLLGGYRSRPPAKLSAIYDVLMALARIATDHPEIVELDINPLLADETGVVALDARVRLRDPALAVPAALVSYPHDLEHIVATNDGCEVVIRPIRPEDAPALQRYIENLDPSTVRARFFETMKRLSPAMLARLTQIDYAREMAFVAIDKEKTPIDADPQEETFCGVGRVIIPAFGTKGIYALTACPTSVGRGVAHALMNDLIAYGRGHGFEELCGDELADSTGLINVARDFGATISHDDADMTKVCIALSLLPIAQAA